MTFELLTVESHTQISPACSSDIKQQFMIPMGLITPDNFKTMAI